MCVMSERTMHKLGLEVNFPSPFKVTLANNSSIKCLGIIKDLTISVCSMEVEVDMYIIASKGEGYPIILGRPWLIIMNAGQKWGIGILVLRPEGSRKSVNKRITYDMGKGKEVDLRYETTVDEESSESSTTKIEEETSGSEEVSSFDIMGLTFQNREGKEREQQST